MGDKKTLEQAFKDAGAPFHIDMKPAKNQADLMQKIKAAVPGVVFITDDDIQKISDRVNKKNRAYEALGTPEERTAYIQKYFQETKKIHDRLPQHLETWVSLIAERMVQEDFAEKEKETKEKKEPTQKDFDKARPAAYQKAYQDLMDEYASVTTTKSGHFFFVPTKATLAFIRIPSAKEGLTDKMITDMGLNKELLTKKWPGSTPDADCAAIIACHEAEHAADRVEFLPQFKLAKYFTDVANGSDVPFKDLKANYKHSLEVESDLSAVQNLQNVVSPESIDYWIGLRIAKQDDQHVILSMEKALGRCNEHYKESTAIQEHDTGFFMDHLDNTGELPDYYSTTKNVNSFYDKTAQFYIDKVNERYKAQGQEIDLKYTVSYPYGGPFIAITKQALKADPPIYTPEEEVIAQSYVNRMGETLGIQEKSYEEWLDMQYKKPIDPPATQPTTEPTTVPATKPSV